MPSYEKINEISNASDLEKVEEVNFSIDDYREQK
jgi:hypothetical protein